MKLDFYSNFTETKEQPEQLQCKHKTCSTQQVKTHLSISRQDDGDGFLCVCVFEHSALQKVQIILMSSPMLPLTLCCFCCCCQRHVYIPYEKHTHDKTSCYSSTNRTAGAIATLEMILQRISSFVPKHIHVSGLCGS